MSRYYRMGVRVEDYNPKRTSEIQEAAKEEWNWEDDWHEHKPKGSPPVMICSGESSLGGGEGEAEFAYRLKLAIWKANQAYCEIGIEAMYLEDLPYESYLGNKKEYEKAKKAGLLEAERENEDMAGSVN